MLLEQMLEDLVDACVQCERCAGDSDRLIVVNDVLTCIECLFGKRECA